MLVVPSGAVVAVCGCWHPTCETHRRSKTQSRAVPDWELDEISQSETSTLQIWEPWIEFMDWVLNPIISGFLYWYNYCFLKWVTISRFNSCAQSLDWGGSIQNLATLWNNSGRKQRTDLLYKSRTRSFPQFILHPHDTNSSTTSTHHVSSLNSKSHKEEYLTHTHTSFL